MSKLHRILGIVAVVGLLVSPLGTVAAEPIPGGELGIPGLEGVCVEPEAVYFSMRDVVPFIVEGAETLPSCVRACSMLGITCSGIMNTQLGCHSTAVTYGSLIAQTLCYGLPFNEGLLECVVGVYETAANLRYEYEDLVEIRAACRELGLECASICGDFGD
jgi:hypothetical protein